MKKVQTFICVHWQVGTPVSLCVLRPRESFHMEIGIFARKHSLLPREETWWFGPWANVSKQLTRQLIVQGESLVFFRCHVVGLKSLAVCSRRRASVAVMSESRRSCCVCITRCAAAAALSAYGFAGKDGAAMPTDTWITRVVTSSSPAVRETEVRARSR